MDESTPRPTPAAPSAPAEGALTRMTDVITSPGRLFASIVQRPTWAVPAIAFLVVMVAALAIFSSRADWVAIDTALIEGMIGRMIPEDKLDEAVKQATTMVRRFSPAQVVVYKTIERTAGVPFFLYGMVLVYATLFVFMGAFPALKLGSAWLSFLLAILVFIGYMGANFVATSAYGEAPASMLLISGTAALATAVAWFWLMHRQAGKDPEFKKILGLCSHAMVIPTIGALAMLLSVFVAATPITIAPEELVRSNLGALIETRSPVLKSFLGSLDLFTLWLMVVLTIAFRTATKLSMGLAASITWLPWAVITMVKMAFRAIFS